VDKLICLISSNSSFIEDISFLLSEMKVLSNSNIDNIKKDDYSLTLIDYDIFGSPDYVQFYLSKVRKKNQDIPVILCIKIEKVNEINYNWFFDDFIIYPVKHNELIMRINRFLWKKELEDESRTIGQFKIIPKEYSVYLNNEKLELTYKEFEILKLMTQNRGVVFSRKDLLERIWGVEYIGGTRTVDVHIRRLRGKLGDEFNSLIETVRNVGYKCRE
jgi:DNA-binding response OmpR family regulator